jgi:hypothetical protein
MVAGKKAFRGESITALLFKIITEEPPSLRELDPKVPDGILHVIGKALAKAPEARYQTGREMADDLLALTRPGFVPTLRAGDTPTIDLPGEIPTLVTPPPPAAQTVASAPTVAKGAAAPGATILTPPPGLPAPPAAPPPLPLVSRPSGSPARGGPPATARKTGAGVGLVVGLGFVGLLLVGALAIGGYVILKRQPAPGPSPTPVAEVTPTPAPTAIADQPTPGPLEATLAPANTLVPTPQPTAGATPRTTVVAPTPATATRRTAATEPGPPDTPATDPPEPPVSAGSLDDYPPTGPDGRAVGEATARAYRGQGGQSGFAGRRFDARPRIPRDVAPLEAPAVKTLAWIGFAQSRYHKQKGRYGTLHELRQERLLMLDVPVQNGRFERGGYAFQLKGGPQEFRVDAQPLSANGRPCYVDDNGFVLWDE